MEEGWDSRGRAFVRFGQTAEVLITEMSPGRSRQERHFRAGNPGDGISGNPREAQQGHSGQ